MNLATSLEIQFDPSLIMPMVGLEPDPWQRQLLRSTSDRILLLASRQIGKSTATALLGLHTAYFNDGALVLLVAPAERQSLLLFRKVADFHRRLGLVRSVKELTNSVELENGSQVIALPGLAETIRGFSASQADRHRRSQPG